MKIELTKRFVKKMIIKTFIFTIIMVIIASIGKSVAPLVVNEFALSQMQNSNEGYVIMTTYPKIRAIVNAVYAGITALFVYTLGRDTYKFVKTINTEDTLEEN